MSWFKLDDQGAFHAKVLAAGNEAYGAWCRAGQWSSGHLTEGLIPRSTALTIARQHVWTKLVAVGLCDSRGDDGWQIHDYLDWNPRADEVIAKRSARAESGRIGGLQSGVSRRSKTEANAKQTLQQNRSKPEANDEANAKQKRTPSPSPFPYPEEIHIRPAPRDERVDEVWSVYVATVKRYRPRRRPSGPSAADRKAIHAHLRAGLTVADLQSACRGLFRSSWHLGLGNGTEYLEIKYALKNPSMFMALDDDVAVAVEPITETRPVVEEHVDPDVLDAELQKIDARFAS